MKRRTAIAIGITLVLLVGVIATLGFAHSYGISDESRRCFPSFWHAQWPKWIGCAMAAHENLAGGLIGGFGALLAAIIAADAVWQQIADAREQVSLAERQRQEIEFDSFLRVTRYYSRLLRAFDGAQGHDHIVFINGMDALYKSGNLVPFFGSLPDAHKSLARDAWERLSNLNHALEKSRQDGMAGAANPGLRNEINNSIREVVADMRTNLEMAHNQIKNAVGIPNRLGAQDHQG
ncbi:hypothetical protein [Bradyrhizobium sp.]|uniref:hypothetical protein n=1 Tax=Bradyrhizobium sp. TaxID=376 RepID=UPI0007C9441E|nr:hypothetical protein [Bradyrhizobium sp.]